MVTAASTADLAMVILVDARKEECLAQTRRHSYIVALLGIRKVILAVNKMDQVGFARETFDSILDEYLEFARQIALRDVVAIPISALKGDNVTEPSPNTRWYHGPDADGATGGRSISTRKGATRPLPYARCNG